MRRHLLRHLPLFLMLATILAALPAAAAPRCVLHEKAALGLMPAACEGGAENTLLADAAPAEFLSAPVNATVGSWAQVLAAANLGGDGRSEAAVLTATNFDPPNDQRLHLFQQDGAALNLLQILPAGSDPAAALALDANLDGRLDVIGALAGDNRLAAFLQDTNYLSDTLALAQPGAPDALASGDFSGDLRPDLAVALPLSDSLRLWQSSSTGLRPSTTQLPFASDGYNALAVGDFNWDDYDDLAALRGSDDPGGARRDLVTVFFQRSGTFPVSTTLSPETGGFLPHSLAAGDVNGDGRDDLLVTAGGNMPNAFLNVYLQGPDGLATTPIVLSAYHLPSAVAVADVNHDGREDVVVAHDGWRTISVYPQGADNILRAYQVATVPYSSRYRPDALAVADLNGDGGLDVAAVSRTPGLSVLNNTLGAPTAVITTPEQYATVPPGTLTVSGTTSLGTTGVEVRVRGLSAWTPATLNGTTWSATVALTTTLHSLWVEARAIAGGRVQAPPAAHRIRVAGRVRDGLVAEYHFDERSGTTAYDRSEVGEPLDLTLEAEQAISRVPDGYFVHTPTRLASPGPAAKVIEALREAEAFTLETWIRTANLNQDGPARILTMSEAGPNLNVALVQQRGANGQAQLALRLQTDTAPGNGQSFHEAVATLPLTTDLTHVLVTRAANGTVSFYINGVEHGRFAAPGSLAPWNADFPLFLANDAVPNRPWLGEYHLAAIYQRALSVDEARQNYAAGPSGDGAPAQLTDAQAVYSFNEGTGDQVGDSALVLPLLPLRIADPSRVSWATGSLTVTQSTVLASEGAATKVNRASMATGELTIEAWLTPANTTQRGPARIATLSENTGARNGMLGQGGMGNQPGDLYLAQPRSTATSHNGEPALRTPAGSLAPALAHVVFTRDAAGREQLFIDGVVRASRTTGGNLGNWEPTYPLVLANELTLNRPWLGSYHFLALYSRALRPEQIAARFAAGPEGNNSRPPTTTVGPFVQRVTINGGASTTADQAITLDVAAQLPTGTSLGTLTVAEYGVDVARKSWTLLQRQTLPASPDGSYVWQLKPGAGIRYLQVWATDASGTTSSYPYQTFINLAPPNAELPRAQVHVYRFALQAGQTFTAGITASRGDADLYVWGPAGGASMRWASTTRGASDQVTLVAPVDGTYQVEVHGYAASRYQLSVSEAAAPAGIAAAPAQADDETLLDLPAISVDSVPEFSLEARTLLFLPLIVR